MGRALGIATTRVNEKTLGGAMTTRTARLDATQTLRVSRRCSRYSRRQRDFARPQIKKARRQFCRRALGDGRISLLRQRRSSLTHAADEILNITPGSRET